MVPTAQQTQTLRLSPGSPRTEARSSGQNPVVTAELSYEMGVYCFKISNHGVQHAVVTMHIVTEADLVQIHAPSSPNKCILPRSTHTHLESECENETSDSTNVFQRHHSRQSTVHVQYPTTSCVYVRSSSLCVPLLPGNQHTQRLHNLVHE